MNPFRNKQPETMAENILQELKNGNTNVLLPLINEFSEDEKKHFLENETKYKIKNWRIGDREDSADTAYIIYWVSREKYPVIDDESGILESVTFNFSHESNDFNLRRFSAVY